MKKIKNTVISACISKNSFKLAQLLCFVGFDCLNKYTFTLNYYYPVDLTIPQLCISLCNIVRFVKLLFIKNFSNNLLQLTNAIKSQTLKSNVPQKTKSENESYYHILFN